MQQILLIHGGDAFDKYEDYLEYLKNFDLNLTRLRKKGWKDNLQKDLGDQFDVLSPRMPNSMNARYVEWKIWFEKILPLLDDNLILVGHSMGGIFLARYLSENKLNKKIKAVFLVATPFYPTDNPYVDFYIPGSLDCFRSQAEKIFLYHSKDDNIVPFSHFEKYREELPGVEVRVFEDRGHFNGEELPELIKDIKDLQGW